VAEGDAAVHGMDKAREGITKNVSLRSGAETTSVCSNFSDYLQYAPNEHGQREYKARGLRRIWRLSFSTA
jgi:hypothetical protein